MKVNQSKTAEVNKQNSDENSWKGEIAPGESSKLFQPEGALNFKACLPIPLEITATKKQQLLSMFWVW